MKKSYIVAFFLTSLISTSLFGSNEALVKKLMELRAEVELLHTEIENERDEYKSEMKSLSMQKSNLEAQINRKETQLKEIRQEVAKVKKKILEYQENNTDIKPLVLEAITNLRTHIENAIPFKQNERLKDLDEIEQQTKSDLIAPQKALAKIWSSYEDAIRLTKENGIFKEVITVGDHSILSEIAKIGMVMIFFKTPDEKVGKLEKINNEWQYIEATDEVSKNEILNLFDALYKQIRTGYFALPNGLIINENGVAK